MESPRPLSLTFEPGIRERIRARIMYAFRVFAAIYNYRVVENAESGDLATTRCFYGRRSIFRTGPSRAPFHIPARYQMGTVESRAAAYETHVYSGESIFTFHGVDEMTGEPDWLGEVFEWLSSAHEMSALRRDPVGRIPFSESVFARQNISPRKPYATLMMAWLEHALHNTSGAPMLAKAPSPVPDAKHLLVCSHDIDFHYTGPISALVRLLKNLGISHRLYRSQSFSQSNFQMIRKLFNGAKVGEYLPKLLEAGQQFDFHSTIFVVPQRHHRRDPAYRLDDLWPHLRYASAQNWAVAVHGSYTSVVDRQDLNSDTKKLAARMQRRPLGNRQHWLRFDRHDKLFDAVERAGLLYDSTLGFTETVGFRNGASFAFPPYDFAKEAPHSFLEIPLIVMDGNLEAACRNSTESPLQAATEVLDQCRKWSWGGAAILWHNPIEPIQVPDEINQIFWTCLNAREEHNEKWVSAEEFLALSLHRYRNAGLMTEARIDA